MNAQDEKKVLRITEELEALAGELSALSGGEAEEFAERLRAAWKGETAGAFLRKAEKLRDEIGSTAAKVRAAADRLRESLTDMKDTG